MPANKRGSSKTTTAASSLSAETTTTASSSSSSSVPPITQGQLGYRGISVEEQTALVEAEIARRRKAAMELAAKSRLAYQQNYAATTGPVSKIFISTGFYLNVGKHTKLKDKFLFFEHVEHVLAIFI